MAFSRCGVCGPPFLPAMARTFITIRTLSLEKVPEDLPDASERLGAPGQCLQILDRRAERDTRPRPVKHRIRASRPSLARSQPSTIASHSCARPSPQLASAAELERPRERGGHRGSRLQYPVTTGHYWSVSPQQAAASFHRGAAGKGVTRGGEAHREAGQRRVLVPRLADRDPRQGERAWP